MKTNTTKKTYVCQLSQQQQNQIKNLITNRLESEGYTESEIIENLQIVLNSKISDLELNIEEVTKLMTLTKQQKENFYFSTIEDLKTLSIEELEIINQISASLIIQKTEEKQYELKGDGSLYL